MVVWASAATNSCSTGAARRDRVLRRVRFKGLASILTIIIITLIVVLPIFFAAWSLVRDVSELASEYSVQDFVAFLRDNGMPMPGELAAASRKVPGHWEADLMMFSKHGHAVLTVHERKSRILFATRRPSKARRALLEHAELGQPDVQAETAGDLARLVAHRQILGFVGFGARHQPGKAASAPRVPSPAPPMRPAVVYVAGLLLAGCGASAASSAPPARLAGPPEAIPSAVSVDEPSLPLAEQAGVEDEPEGDQEQDEAQAEASGWPERCPTRWSSETNRA